jgi:hypothetical protein
MSVSKTKSGYLFGSDQHYGERKGAFNRSCGIIDAAPMSIRRSLLSGDLSVIPDADSGAVEDDAQQSALRERTSTQGVKAVLSRMSGDPA